MSSHSRSTNPLKPRPSFGDGPSSSKPRIDPSSLKKKTVEISIKSSSSDVKNRSIVSASKMVKTSSTQSKDVTKKAVTKPREKKVFSLPGQKHDVPEEREPLRIFYETLSKQIPSSEMAEFWLMEHGMLSPDRARKAYEKKQRRAKELRSGIPIKSLPPPVSSRPESSKRPMQAPKNGETKAKKRIANDSDDEDDIVLSHKIRKW